MKVVLASTSKFKSEILNKVHIKHSLVKSDFDESKENSEDVYKYVRNLAFSKAKSIIDKCPNSIVIGLDTIVYVNNKILGKPKDIKEAREYIDMCKNNTTSVITGVSIINTKTNEIINDYAETIVTLRNISDLDIDYYFENEEGILDASGFIIENIMSNFIEKIDGSYYNILGIPVETIYKHINNMGYHLKYLETK